MRFGFGKNWEKFIKNHFSEERVQISKNHILDFLGMDNLSGKSFLDVGCGSGIHSYAILKAGASRIVSFDYDSDAVTTTRMLKKHSGDPENWEIMQGSILDTQFISKLSAADIVYAWGVLHHTGDMWKAIDNSSLLVKKGGLLYIALYTARITIPSDDFWLDKKQQYNQGGWILKRKMELWYIWVFMLKRDIHNLPEFLERNRNHKKTRGMDLYVDIIDWLGGWPMEFADIEKVKQFCGEKLGLKLVKIKTGDANTEYLFQR